MNAQQPARSEPLFATGKRVRIVGKRAFDGETGVLVRHCITWGGSGWEVRSDLYDATYAIHVDNLELIEE